MRCARAVRNSFSSRAARNACQSCPRSWAVEPDVAVFPLDLSRPDAVSVLMAFLQDRGITVDLLVNNAGVGLDRARSSTSQRSPSSRSST